jgi:Carboxypeptidase regulatory-like domain
VTVLVTIFLALSSAQQLASSSVPVSGVVRDETGAILPAARVDLVNESGITTASTATDNSGQFRFPAVEPGTYQLRVQFEGFRPSTTELRVTTRRAPPLQSIVLRLAAIPQEITVNSDDAAITGRIAPAIQGE